MKISWGWKITLSYILFFIIIMSFVFFSFTQDVNLVTENYYEKELEYQNHIDKVNRTNSLPEKLEISYNKDLIKAEFPNMFIDEEIKGNFVLYRPSNGKEDITIPIELTENKQFIGTEKLSTGLWRLKVDWNAKGISYFNEKLIMIN